jgi:hypothetical protein
LIENNSVRWALRREALQHVASRRRRRRIAEPDQQAAERQHHRNRHGQHGGAGRRDQHAELQDPHRTETAHQRRAGEIEQDRPDRAERRQIADERGRDRGLDDQHRRERRHHPDQERHDALADDRNDQRADGAFRVRGCGHRDHL